MAELRFDLKKHVLQPPRWTTSPGVDTLWVQLLPISPAHPLKCRGADYIHDGMGPISGSSSLCSWLET